MTTTKNEHNRTKWHCLNTNKKQYSKFLILWGSMPPDPPRRLVPSALAAPIFPEVSATGHVIVKGVLLISKRFIQRVKIVFRDSLTVFQHVVYELLETFFLLRLTATMTRPWFSSETLLSTLRVRSRSADGSKRLDNNSNFGAEYYAVGKKTRIALR